MSVHATAGTYQDHSPFTAADSRKSGFLAVPLSAVREHGQSSLTLAAILQAIRQDGKTTRRRQNLLASIAGVSPRTFRSHLAQLEASGLVLVKRRAKQSNVYAVTRPESELMAGGFLPLVRYGRGLPWCQQVVLAWIIYRAEVSGDQATCEDSLGRISESVGITRRQVINAASCLEASGLVERSETMEGESVRFSLLAPPPRPGSEKAASQVVKSSPPTSEKAASLLKKGSKKMVQERSVDQIRVSSDEVLATASDLFRRAGYSGNEGRNLWKVAALVDAGKVSQHEATDAACGASECKAADRAAYFVAIVKSHVAKRGADLVAMLRTVRFEPTLPTSPPRVTPTGLPLSG